MSEGKFQPQKHMMRVQGGREYLPVSARLVWFREEHPDWGIVTQPVEINLEKQYAIFSASIFNAEGKLMATATKMENVRGFADYLEKAETGSVGRALAYCGYGTQFAPELEEGGRIADSPGGNRYGGGNRANGASSFNNRPMPARPAPARPPREDVPIEDEAPVPEPPGEPTPVAARSAERPAAPAARAVSSPPVTTRVKEPVADDDLDPGGPGEDEEDPFADLDESAPARATPSAPPARAAAARAAASPAGESDVTITENRCSVEGCPAVLTQGQLNMSLNKFGKALCPLHQREATPIAGAGGGAKRGAKPELTETLL